jgi:hypothetical protein
MSSEFSPLPHSEFAPATAATSQSAVPSVKPDMGELSPAILSHNLEKLDLSVIQGDKTLPLHKLQKSRINEDGFSVLLTVIDFDHVYMSKDAGQALERCYLLPAFLLDKFGNHYKKNIVTECTRGKLKGVKYLNPKANVYVHEAGDGIDIVIAGKSIEQDGKTTRQIHITCRPHEDLHASACSPCA